MNSEGNNFPKGVKQVAQTKKEVMARTKLARDYWSTFSGWGRVYTNKLKNDRRSVKKAFTAWADRDEAVKEAKRAIEATGLDWRVRKCMGTYTYATAWIIVAYV